MWAFEEDTPLCIRSRPSHHLNGYTAFLKRQSTVCVFLGLLMCVGECQVEYSLCLRWRWLGHGYAIEILSKSSPIDTFVAIPHMLLYKLVN